MAMAQWVRHILSFLNGFRKLVICLITLTLATVALYVGFIDGPTYGSVLTVTVPSYFAGNIGEHLTSSVAQWLKEKARHEQNNKS